MEKHRHGIERFSTQNEGLRAKGDGFGKMLIYEGLDFGPAGLCDRLGQAIGVFIRGYASVINTLVSEDPLVSSQTLLQRASTSFVCSDVKYNLH